MFKRMGREKDKAIGNPVLLQTTYDEETLERIPNVSDLQSPKAFRPQDANRFLQSYNSSSPYDASQYYGHTALSGYSQPFSEAAYGYPATAESSSAWTDIPDISPPSSPEAGSHQQQQQPRRFRSMRDVSPVDANRGRSRGAVKYASNIPIPRKVSAGNQNIPVANTFWGGKVSPHNTVRWDEYSGEPTSSTRGRPSQVSPGSYAKASLPGEQQRGSGYRVSVGEPSANMKKTAASEHGRIPSKPTPAETNAKPREAWKGASGRVAIAQPLEDQLLRTPVKFPQRKVSEERHGPGRNTPSSAAAVTQKRVTNGTDEPDTSPVADHHEELDTHDNPIKPIVPLKVGKNSPPRSIASPVPPLNSYSYPSPITPTYRVPQSPSTILEEEEEEQEQEQEQEQEEQEDEDEWNQDSVQPLATPPSAKGPRKSIERTQELSENQVPTSRFSWTTYNTSTTYQHSPPPSPPPPMPAAPLILNRVLTTAASDKIPARKPITATTARPHSDFTTTPSSPRPGSAFTTSTTHTTDTLNTHKALPRPPTELATSDHIEILEAQLADIRLRHSNVGRLLSDLNTLAPPNPFVTDFRRMRLREARKKEFEDELADIRREEHEVGLRLHRAWRRREREDPNGSESAIWVRRVTR
ncbi:hypothetical protein GQ43DRAFT_468607 [Delitschia confertaspora ATCC 74209]|uniref:Uncharacterized protein n=1 Tax=Delitschia confertaspora ATCC 74209 TaxID=1513339 RepID=A0A9P4JTV3_9PLEO|nr:hypothetical protein GQ43DRAFT_468607 [Delitschia confertaspora ATCC 74209]